jgi:hypothetical protein
MSCKINRSNHNLANIFSYFTNLEIVKYQQLNKKFYKIITPRLLDQNDYQAEMETAKNSKWKQSSTINIFRFGMILTIDLNKIINYELEFKWCVDVPKNYHTAR